MFLNVKRLSFEIEYLRNEITVDHLRVITVKFRVDAFTEPRDSHLRPISATDRYYNHTKKLHHFIEKRLSFLEWCHWISYWHCHQNKEFPAKTKLLSGTDFGVDGFRYCWCGWRDADVAIARCETRLMMCWRFLRNIYTSSFTNLLSALHCILEVLRAV